jgi:hypothetical protein
MVQLAARNASPEEVSVDVSDGALLQLLVVVAASQQTLQRA